VLLLRYGVASSMPHTTLIEQLRDALGPKQVLTDADLRAPYETDWTRRFSGSALAVARPADTAEVAAVVRACAEHGVPVVPQGGNTGLVGAGVPRGGEVLLSLARLDDIGDVDVASAQVEAGAGATLAALHARAAAAGMDAALDFGARDSATLGGIVATDAGGARALRHGTARARVAGLEAVLPDGRVVRRLSGLLKDNAGYDLPALLVGSEGTLGVITRIRWRLVARQPARVAALVGLESAGAAADLLATLRSRLPSLEAADFFLEDGLALVLEQLELPDPLSEHAPVYVLIECAAEDDPTEALAEALAEAGVDDAIVADDTASRERLWRLREGHAEAINAAGVPHKLDVGVPLAVLEEFLTRVREAIAGAAPGARPVLFGHLGDGNVHVNVLGAPPDDPAVDEAVLRLVAELGGTISAEHGIGVAKARWLPLVRGEADLAAMAALKRALDPGGMLNPGAVIAG
jgi:FAD/FMN-containing dehydrogenase